MTCKPCDNIIHGLHPTNPILHAQRLFRQEIASSLIRFCFRGHSDSKSDAGKPTAESVQAEIDETMEKVRKASSKVGDTMEKNVKHNIEYGTDPLFIT